MHRSITSNEMHHRDEAMQPKISATSALTPCTGCDHAERCSSEHLACAAFKTYIGNKSTMCRASLWDGQPKEPSAKIYAYIWENKTGRM